MKLFHVDRGNRLGELIGCDIPLLEDGFSFHGKTYSFGHIIEQSSDCYNFMIEHYFELVREARFPEMPSRFASMFACDSDGIRLWYKALSHNSEVTVYEIEGSNQFRFDGALLSLGPYINNRFGLVPKYANLFANTYWQQLSSEGLRQGLIEEGVPAFAPPEWEYLVQFPVRVHRKVDKQDVLLMLNP